jgi:tRNA modification GTPase
MGVERSRAALAQADLALLVIDGHEPLTDGDREIAHLVGDKPIIVVINKTDLPVIAAVGDLLPAAPRVELSALTGEGIAELEEAIKETVFTGRVLASDTPLVSNPRHRDVLRRACGHVEGAIRAWDRGLPADLMTIDLRDAVNALGEITGETVSATLLETIFSRFCIGK